MLREFFTREAAKKVAQSVDRSKLISVREALALVQQKRRAAELLWASGHLAEGLRLVRSAYSETQRALLLAARLNSGRTDGLNGIEVSGDVEPNDEHSQALHTFVQNALGDKLHAADKALSDEAPATNDEVSSRDAANFERLVAATKRGESVLDKAKPLEMLVASSRRRIAVFAIGLLALTAVLVAFVVSRQKKANAPWRADYFANANLRGEPIVDREPSLELRWGPNSPRSGIPADGFSARFETCLELDEPMRFEVKLGTDDGGRLYVNGTQRINRWRDQAYGVSESSFEIPAGQNLIRVEFYDRGGDARLEFNLEHEEFKFEEHIRYISEASECQNEAEAEEVEEDAEAEANDEAEAEEEGAEADEESEETPSGEGAELAPESEETETPAADSTASPEAENEAANDEQAPAAAAMDMLGGTPMPSRARRAEEGE